MSPAAATRRPARSISLAVSAVVVVLPLVPVTASSLLVALPFLQLGERDGEQVPLGLHRHAGGARRPQQRRDARVVRRQARALQHEADAGECLGGGVARDDLECRELLAQCGHRGHLGGARVPGAHGGAVAQAPARHRLAALAEADQEHGGALQVAHRGHLSFRLASPNRHSSIVTIQKRTTTWPSAQPFFSK